MLNAIQRAAVRHLTARHFSPPDTRMTDVDWCKIVGIVPKTIQRWKADPEFQAALEASIAQMEETQDPFAACARAFALEQMVVQYQKSQGADKRQYLKLIIENTEHVADAGDAVCFDELSDEDLVNLALSRDVTPAAMTAEQLRRIAKGEPCSTSSSAPSPLAVASTSDTESDSPPE